MKKERIEIRFSMQCSEVELFNKISTPAGLASWYADHVKIDGRNFSFFWADTEQKAELLSINKLKDIRLHWLDDEEKDAYFEFCIQKKEDECVLTIIDFVEEEDKEDAIDLYETQVEALKILLENKEISEIFI